MVLPTKVHIWQWSSEKQYAKHMIASQISWCSNPNHEQSKSNQFPIFWVQIKTLSAEIQSWKQTNCNLNPIAIWLCPLLLPCSRHMGGHYQSTFGLQSLKATGYDTVATNLFIILAFYNGLEDSYSYSFNKNVGKTQHNTVKCWLRKWNSNGPCTLDRNFISIGPVNPEFMRIDCVLKGQNSALCVRYLMSLPLCYITK